MSETKLPKDWKTEKVSCIANLIRGINYSKDVASNNDSDNSLPILRGNNINVDLNFDDLVYVPKSLIKPEQIIKKDDIIFAMSSGSKHLVGKTAVAKTDFKGSYGAFCALLRINEGINKKYVSYIFKGNTYRKLISEIAKGTSINNLKREHILDFEFPLPPPETQQAIVSKIDELFSELDKGIEDLKTAQQQLNTYRQSVLKWAFEGKLTNENVKEGELPQGWEMVTIENVANKITDGEHFRPPTQSDGIAFLSAKDVRDNGVSFEEPLYISEETANKALQRCNPQLGDILIVSRGATVGRMCIVNTNITFCLLGSVILIKVNDKINNLFLNYVLKSPIANQKMITVSGATAQQAIYLRDIKKIEIPLPPIEEQHLIVQEIESRLSVADKMEESIGQSLQQAEALRQSILKKAFSGELV